jgi:hypothetical protein
MNQYYCHVFGVEAGRSWTGEVVWLLKGVEVELASIITLGFRLL